MGNKSGSFQRNQWNKSGGLILIGGTGNQYQGQQIRRFSAGGYPLLSRLSLRASSNR